MPTGGVTLGNIKDYLGAGAAALGVGTDLVNLGLLEMHGPEALTVQAKAFVEALEQ
jgi:2-dehydro-3-deoxyphosphogluconate aldolase/(4S)-4-hydroxy-2-oxoglutarate aldolase